MNILVTGSLAFDYIFDYPNTFEENIDPTKLHILNLSFLVDNFKKQNGGTAGNIAYNLSLLKTPVSILGVAGSDFKEYGTLLKRTGVNISQIKFIKNDSSASAFIITDKKDNQITAFYPGAMKRSDALSLKNLKAKPDFCVISPNVPEVMIKLAKECQSLKIQFMFDPGMQLSRLTDQELLTGLKGAQILIGNDYEIGLIKKRLKVTDDDLLKEVEILITTLGDRGAVIKTDSETIEIPVAKPKEVLDPTGAGDAFRAGFLAGFLRCSSLKYCGLMGALASCYTVEKYGTTTHKFNLPQFKKRFKQNFGLDLKIS